MRRAMLDLLARLQRVGERHEELGDSDVAEAMTLAIHDCFLRPVPRGEMTRDFRLATATGNRQVCMALMRYVGAVLPIAHRLKLAFHQRLAIFQDPNVTWGDQEIGVNDFFRYTPPGSYDKNGEPIADGPRVKTPPTSRPSPSLPR